MTTGDAAPPAGHGILAGRTVVVTRASHQTSRLVSLLRGAGAEVIAAPAIAVVPPLDGGQPLDDALLRLDRFRWIALTSANAVAAMFTRAQRRGVRRGFAAVRTAVAGPATAARLEAELGRPADLVAHVHSAAGLAAAFPHACSGGGRVFAPRSAAAGPHLTDGLRAKGWDVTAVTAYRLITPLLSDHLASAIPDADAVLFASPSAVHGHLSQMRDRPRAGRSALSGCPAAVCIGPTTAQACRRAGLPPAAVAQRQTDEGLFDATAALLAQPAR